MRKTRSQTRYSLLRVQTGALDLTIHLYTREGESVGESGTVLNERRALTESAVSGCLESDVDDESEVFGSEESRNVFVDQVETSLEPFCGFGERRVDVGLSASHKAGSALNGQSKADSGLELTFEDG